MESRTKSKGKVNLRSRQFGKKTVLKIKSLNAAMTKKKNKHCFLSERTEETFKICKISLRMYIF